LNREEQERRNEDDDYEDDLKSISSESSGEGIPIPFSIKGHSRDECQLWDIAEIEASLRALPKADIIEAAIKAGNYQHEFASILELNVGLMFSIWYRQLEYAARLLRQGAHASSTDTKQRSALHYACIKSSAPLTRLLLHFKADPNVYDEQHKLYPLHYAAIVGSSDCINLLIRNGAQVNAGIEKKSALYYAVQQNSIKCVNILLQYHADPNIKQNNIESPLHIASEMGYVECVKALLIRGANVNCMAGNKRNSPLHLAAEDDFSDCVKLLLGKLHISLIYTVSQCSSLRN
jgi:ankyrin repeat protein